MGSDHGVVGRRRSMVVPGVSPSRKWPSPLLNEELSLQTLADTAYVRLVHPDDAMGMCRGHAGEATTFEHDDARKGTRAAAAWSWLKQGWYLPKETVQVGLAKSRSHNAWSWLGRPPVEEFQFDPSRRWPQGW